MHRRLHHGVFVLRRTLTHYYSSQHIVPRNHDIATEKKLLRELLSPAIASGRVSLDPIMFEHLYNVGGEVARREVA